MSHSFSSLERPRVYLALPHYNGRIAAEEDGRLFQGVDRSDTRKRSFPTPHIQFSKRGSSALTWNFNMLWADALNQRKNGVTHFAMLHADVLPDSYWLDILLGELIEHQAGVVSCVIPIKDDRGVTTTAIGRVGTIDTVKRLTVREARRLPRTFTAADAGYPDNCLLINTGCWICDLRQPWVDKFPGFTVVDALYTDGEGKLTARFFSEDWWFGVWLAGQGIKVMATTAVYLAHLQGDRSYRNDHDWGLETDPGESPATPALLDSEPALVKEEAKQRILVMSRETFAAATLDRSKTALISFCDPDLIPPDRAGFKDVLGLSCRDVVEALPDGSHPISHDAKHILAFVSEHKDVPTLVIQCEAGVGRSMATAAALLKIDGGDNRELLRPGTYNRLLYRLLLEQAGVEVDADPLVSLVVRLKYPADRFLAFLASVKRQRYANHEVVAVTDGPMADDMQKAISFNNGDCVLRWVHTPRRLGRWGHPYRQRGIDACRGDIIGLANDDNYLTPGFVEQLVFAMQEQNAPLAMCDCLHAYHGWQHVQSSTSVGSTDLNCWLARAELIRQVPWTDDDFHADGRYFRRLVEAAAGKVAHVKKPLVVKN